MTTKTFKPVQLVLAMAFLFSLSGCLHNPEIPFIRPNELSTQEAQSIKKIASIVFSDLLFESPLGDRAFSSVKFDYDLKNKRYDALANVMKKLIRKDSTIYCAAVSLKNPTFIIKLEPKLSQKPEDINLILIENQTKESVYTKSYQLRLK